VERTETVRAPVPGSIVALAVDHGALVAEGATLCVIESMKLEHVVTAGSSGLISSIDVRVGDVVSQGQILATLVPQPTTDSRLPDEDTISPAFHTSISEMQERRVATTDESRPAAVAKMHNAGKLTAREKVALLLDKQPALEYGTFTIAAQRARRSVEDLIERTPADGLVAMIGPINTGNVDAEDATAAVLAYDTTVLAGTQGVQNHRKMDRLLDIAADRCLPVVMFADGGGGRPGDTDMAGRAGLDVPTFASLARLSGSVPLVAVVSGYCFAGNAILAGMCDIIIATRDAHIGAGGPSMIEGGGLGTVTPDEIGPAAMHAGTGVVGILVDDDAEAVATARRYTAFFQGSATRWSHDDQSSLRAAIPQNHRRTYDVRSIVTTIADTASVLEIGEMYGRSLVTALARVEGVTVGIVANDPAHGGGAIDASAAIKGTRFLDLCASFRIPIVSLIDTPGIMVGTEAEQEATVLHASRLFIATARHPLRVMAVVMRRGYGLGAMAMAGGGFKETDFTVAWPSATIGPMGLEGAVTLGYRRELDAIEDDSARRERYEALVAEAYDAGKAINAATWFDVDEVIDPADTRSWIASFL